ncbi:MAG: hypothetical protein RLZ64_2006, partial [Pseudomonadota bacterium]
DDAGDGGQPDARAREFPGTMQALAANEDVQQNYLSL